MSKTDPSLRAVVEAAAAFREATEAFERFSRPFLLHHWKRKAEDEQKSHALYGECVRLRKALFEALDGLADPAELGDGGSGDQVVSGSPAPSPSTATTYWVCHPDR
jgi:hypothetical protein